MKSIHEIENQISACAERRAARRLGLWSMLGAPLIVLAFVANAHATVRCVSPSGTVPPGQAKKAGCSATISKTIGGAIAAAAAGDTVFVFDGSYNEMVTIDSTLTGLSLLGRDPKKTIISAANKSNGIVDEANGVTIIGFTITKANHEGILVEGSTGASCSMGVCTPGDQITGVTISNNIVKSNDQQLDTSTSPPTCPGVPGVPDFDAEDCGEAVHLDGVAFSTVSNNVIKKNAGGILLTDENNSNHDNLVAAIDVPSTKRAARKMQTPTATSAVRVSSGLMPLRACTQLSLYGNPASPRTPNSAA